VHFDQDEEDAFWAASTVNKHQNVPSSLSLSLSLSLYLSLSLCLLFLLLLLQAAGEHGRWLHLPTLKRSKIHAPKEKNKNKNINIKIENLLLLYWLVNGLGK